MKRCPTCRRTYPDDAQNFCLDDGTTLVRAGVSVPNPTPYDRASAPTNMVFPRATAGHKAEQPTIPPFLQYQSQQQQQRSPLPWILGIVGVVVAGVVVTIFLVRNGSSSSSTSSASSTSSNTSAGTPGKVDVNISTPSSSSTSTTTTTTSSASSQSWQPLTGDQFSVSMPGTPMKSDQTEPSPAGPIQIHLYTVSQGYEGYIVGYSEYPDLVFSSGNNDVLLNGARDGAIQNVNGKILNERNITLSGYPGREITGNAPSQNISFTARLFIAKPRMYMLMYTQYGVDKPLSEDGRRFLDSFQITK
ncbi:MAG TPA: hypothetical protein VF791_05940 [Pyrinomonadaceae bacterium]